MSDEAPSIATIFRFLGYIQEYDAGKAKDEAYVGLLKRMFSSITEDALSRTGLSKDTIRVDSTFLDSNIKRYGRIQLLIESIQRLWRILSKADKETYREMLAPYIKEDSGHFLYTLEEKDVPKSEQRLVAVYTGLYTTLKHSSDITSSSLQSPDDTDATYRNKNGEKHQGHLAQITETVDCEKDLSLITDVAVTANNKDDANYLAKKIGEYAEKGAKNIHVDGGYGSEAVDSELAEHDVAIYQSAVKGKKSNSPLTIKKTERNTFELLCPFQQVAAKKNQKRYVVKFDMSQCRNCPHQANCPAGKNKGKHYFNIKDYRKQKRHHAYKELTKKEKNIRSGCERTMHELYHDRKHGKKMRVRGHFSMERDTICRSIGVNFMRIMRWCVKNGRELSPEGILAPIFTFLTLFSYNIRMMSRLSGVNRYENILLYENNAEVRCR